MVLQSLFWLTVVLKVTWSWNLFPLNSKFLMTPFRLAISAGEVVQCPQSVKKAILTDKMELHLLWIWSSHRSSTISSLQSSGFIQRTPQLTGIQIPQLFHVTLQPLQSCSFWIFKSAFEPEFLRTHFRERLWNYLERRNPKDLRSQQSFLGGCSVSKTWLCSESNVNPAIYISCWSNLLLLLERQVVQRTVLVLDQFGSL